MPSNLVIISHNNSHFIRFMTQDISRYSHSAHTQEIECSG